MVLLRDIHGTCPDCGAEANQAHSENCTAWQEFGQQVDAKIEHLNVPRRFILERDEDVSGMSGTGVVADGVQFTDGQAVLHWRTRVHSTAIYANVDELMIVHGHGGKTRLGWLD